MARHHVGGYILLHCNFHHHHRGQLEGLNVLAALGQYNYVGDIDCISVAIGSRCTELEWKLPIQSSIVVAVQDGSHDMGEQ